MIDHLSPTAAAIYGALTGSTALTSLLAGTASIYDTQSPDGAAYPYVVFSLQAGGSENIAPSDLQSDLWFIRAYTGTSHKSADAIKSQIDTVIHRHTLALTGGWVNVWTARETNLRGIENLPNGQKVYMSGGFYRIRLTD